MSCGRQAGTLPTPKTYASQQQYAQLIQRAELAGMLRWSKVGEESPEYKKLADAIQLTTFAVSKSKSRARLISWPRIQNNAMPDPPHTPLPEPSLFEAVEVHGSNQSATYLDIANMFHNITLPLWLTKLLPLRKIKQ